ncbi:MAG TPA: U32 family peptidase [Thiolapillus brandeum]|uniref:Ubiquinone biosynthesis protein UbiV n=1 Tax=Thiolapillus brandeum TaxID=1076588 RepID=A0A831W7T0_9GAMM|nr:U32 family peptidase [Thiolapillus brandeum]
MKLSLGPVQYYWSREDLLDFYRQVADMPVDLVYLGETVCSKRRLFRFDDWMDTARMLRDAGKEVVLSTLALLEAESELKTLRRICANGEFLVEANDMAAVQLLSAAGLPFVAGPTVNIYNAATLGVLADAGLKRWVPAVELDKDTLAAIGQEAPEQVETELFAWGRMPLAMSARCYTARAYDLPKDDCQYRCLDHADGLTLRTREGEPFLAINGIQTQSALTCNLLPEIKTMDGLGIDVLRISPQARHTDRIVQAFAEALQGGSELPDLQRLMPVGGCDGYWHGEAGMRRHSA